MFLLDRLRIAIKTEAGALLLLLAAALAVLVALFLFLLWRQKKKEAYTATEKAYFDSAAKRGNFKFSGKHRARFFGRESPIVYSEGKEAVCMIPAKDMAYEETVSRLFSFYDAFENISPHAISIPSEIIRESPFCLVYEKEKGQPLARHLLDSRLTKAEKETFLLSAAKALGALHSLSTSDGEKLYHGFLLPQNVWVEEGRAVLKEAGFAFSLRSEGLFHRISRLKSGILKIEKASAYTIFEQLAFLAPEQRDEKRLSEVSRPADFYAFGTLACFAFTGKKTFDQVDWEAVPQFWRPFLEQCLQEDSGLRPKSFKELENWLNDPELALTVLDGRVEEREEELEEGFVFKSKLSDVIQEMAPTREEKSSPARPSDTFSRAYDAGVRAFKGSKWAAAGAHFEEALKISPDHSDALVKYAIVCYELGELEIAERHYRKAKENDPVAAKAFRKHIAFRI